MKRYALDTDVLSALKPARDQLIGQGSWPVVITDVVWDEFLAPGGRPADLVRDRELLESLCSGPTIIEPQTAQAAAFARLEGSVPQIGAGELSILAVALNDPEVVPVLLDQRALYRAVEELRGRVLSFHGLLGELQAAGSLPAQVAKALSESFRRRRNFSPPLWW